MMSAKAPATAASSAVPSQETSPLRKRLRGASRRERPPKQQSPPPPDLPEYIQVHHLPKWLQERLVHTQEEEELTPLRVDELHHTQWFAWRDEKNYARVLEPAPSLFNARFVSFNANNFSITVGLTTEALWRTGNAALTVANTFLYGMYLLRDQPAHLSTPKHFCKAALAECMDAWALEVLGPPGPQSDERLLRLCRAYPHSDLPNVLGRRLKDRVEPLLSSGQFSSAHTLLQGILNNPEREAWVTLPGVWDENLYWRLRLLSYLAKYRSKGGGTTGSCKVRVSALVFARSQGRLPPALDSPEDDEDAERGWVECGRKLSREEMDAMLSSLRAAFALFSSTYLALTGGLIEWVLDFEEERDIHWDSALLCRKPKRERTGPTNPDRIIAQPDIEGCKELRELLGQERMGESQAVLVVWPGLQPPADYMCTCGGVAPRGPGDRFVYMSDGTMMDREPFWSPEWWHHETFHVIEHLFPEAPFSKLSEQVGHPCFLRDRWPAGYTGLGECDYYYWSYKLHCLTAKPTLVERLGRKPGERNVFTLEVHCEETSRIVNRLAKGDIIVLQGRGILPLNLNDVGRGLVFKGEGGAEGSVAVWRDGALRLLVTVVPGGGDIEEHERLLLTEEQGTIAKGSHLLPSSPRTVAGRAAGRCISITPPQPAFSVADLLCLLAERAKKCVQDDTACTYQGTGPHWVKQQWYKCRTCIDAGRVNGSVGLCVTCSRCCHKGHELIEQDFSPFYCDCAPGGFPGFPCIKARDVV